MCCIHSVRMCNGNVRKWNFGANKRKKIDNRKTRWNFVPTAIFSCYVNSMAAFFQLFVQWEMLLSLALMIDFFVVLFYLLIDINFQSISIHLYLNWSISIVFNSLFILFLSSYSMVLVSLPPSGLVIWIL